MDARQQDANVFIIRGFPVHFPKGKKPFAPQLALMSKLLTGVQKGENCLLESPTGTGKTLALLSAALAWQRRQRENGTVSESDEDSDYESAGEGHDDVPIINVGHDEPLRSFSDFRYVENKESSPSSESESAREVKAPIELAYEDSVGSGMGGPAETAPCQDDIDDDIDAFESPKKKRQKQKLQPLREHDAHRTDEAEVDFENSGTAGASTNGESPSADIASGCCTTGETGDQVDPIADVKPSSKAAGTASNSRAKSRGRRAKTRRRRVPRVFFCSRTHSQLNQVVAELRTCRTAFHNTSAVGIGEDGSPFSMALLASRKGTCINADARNDPKGIDDACKRLLKDKACYYQRRSKWAPTKLPPVWDVEDAIRLGKENQTCPYYTARTSLETADLVLCPYNYLVDPGVREIMGINLRKAVVIFDEAHNLEDSAREAASAKLSLRALATTASELQRLGAKARSLAPSYDLLREVVVGVKAFVEEIQGGLVMGGYEKAHRVFRGTEALGLMQCWAGVTSKSLVQVKDALTQVMNENREADPYGRGQEDPDDIYNQDNSEDVLSSGSLHVTTSLVKVLGFLLAEGMENVAHYKMVVLRERGPWQSAADVRVRGRRSRAPGDRNSGAGAMGSMETFLCFWCQSAGVCFSEIDAQVHSIVLTSGTLSPLNSFAGELGIDFLHRLEAPHVINVAQQCLVTSVGHFGDVSLDARYSNQHNLKYQDALGNALLKYAHVVPGGMLVFFPSYGLLEKMRDRWQATGLLRALETVKAVFSEPRGQGKIDGVLAGYYEAIEAAKKTSEDDDGRGVALSGTGALMLAVARGKVSEGIDFSDDAARMCIIVGIPYPSARDLQVTLKKEYQNQRRQTNTQLVGGKAWYNLQAFRAVNQAVGRCIRHRNDFGAIVLCDPRYASQAETTASLSKWIRSSVKQCRAVEASLWLVDDFFQHHQPRPQSPATSGSSARADDESLGPVSLNSMLPSNAVYSCDGAGCERDGSTCENESCDRTEEARPQGCEATRDENVEGKGAREGSPGFTLKQTTLSQMFQGTQEHQASAPSYAINSVVGDDSAGPNSGTHGRVVLGALSAQTRVLETDERGTSATDHRSRLQSPSDQPCSPPRWQSPGFYCRSDRCEGGALASQPVGGGACPEKTCDGPRRVVVRENCHLGSAASKSSCPDQGTIRQSSPPLQAAQSRLSLLEAPRSWVLGKSLSCGDARWVASDRLVYASLSCSCSGCGFAHVGEMVVAAGLGGDHLIQRAWFFTDRVESDGIDRGADVELHIPALSSPP